MKKKIGIIFSLFIFALGIFITNSLFYDNENINDEIKLLADETNVDYSLPASNNSEKKYVSNIPDEYYLSNYNYSYDILNDDNISYYREKYSFISSYEDYDCSYTTIDFINEDATINYANKDKTSIIEMVVGQTYVFYLEEAVFNFDASYWYPYETFRIENGSSDLGLKITQEYGDTTYNLFDMENDGTAFSKYSWAADNNSYNTLSKFAEVTEDGVALADNYHLVKFEFTPTATGYSNFSITADSISSGGSTPPQYNMVIHVKEADGASINDRFFSIDSISGSSFNSIEFNNALEDSISYGISIPFKTNTTYQLNGSYLPEYEDKDQYCGLYETYISNDSNLTISGNNLYFKETGIYNITASLIYIYNATDTDGSNVQGILNDVINIKLNVYSDEDIKIDNSIASGSNLYISTDSLNLKMNKFNNSSFNVSYLLNDEEITSLASLSEGEYRFNINLHDNLWGIEYNKYYTLFIVKPNELYKPIELNNDTFIVEFDKQDELSIIMNNYSYVYPLAELDIVTNSDDFECYFNNREIKVSASKLGNYNVTIYAYYESVIKTTEFTIAVVSKYTFGLSSNKVNMFTNSVTTISLGYILNSNLIEFSDKFYDYYDISVYSTDDNIELTQNKNVITIKSNSNELTATCNIGIIASNDLISVLTFTVYVTPPTEEIPTSVSFVEGKNITLLLTEATKSITLTLDIDDPEKYNFTWICLDTRVAGVIKTSNKTATVTAISAGSTELIAVCQTEYGITISAKATINVLSSVPTIDVAFDKNNESAFTIYDSIFVALNSNGFTFSNDVTLKWYLDDNLLSIALDKDGNSIPVTNKTISFYLKLNDGIHTFTIELEDRLYNLSLSATREINVLKEENTQRELSFKEENVYLIRTGDEYLMKVLIDGVENLDYTYTFWSSNNKVVSIYMSTDNQVLIKPNSVGEATIYAMTNIGKYEENIISAAATINVLELSSITLKANNDYYKPGDNVSLEILINGRNDIKNIQPKITAKISDVEIEYELDGNIINIQNIDKGNLTVNVIYDDINAEAIYKITSFSLTKLVKEILPYLLIVMIIVVSIYFVFIASNNPYKNATTAINKLKKQMDMAIEELKDNSDITNMNKYCRKLIKKAIKLSRTLEYYSNEGVDEFKNTLSKIDNLVKILNALEKTPNDKLANMNVYSTFIKINETYVLAIENMINIIISARKKYDETVAKNNSKEEKLVKKVKKNKITSEEYYEYLSLQGVLKNNESED